MKLDQVIAELQALKGTGEWFEIAKATGIHYDTLARIARRKVTPRVDNVEKIVEVIAAIHARSAEPTKSAA